METACKNCEWFIAPAEGGGWKHVHWYGCPKAEPVAHGRAASG